MRRLLRLALVLVSGIGLSLLWAHPAAAQDRPNVVWIVAEDASPHVGAYGERLIETPHLDRMAADGVRFDAAFVTTPICSPARSALITGLYQTTLGAHNHRSQTLGGKGGGNVRYYDSYALPEGVRLVPALFQEAGYYTVLGRPESLRGETDALAKSDYNFAWDRGVYDGADWSGRAPGQPFFAQVQLRGGKGRTTNVPSAVDPDDVVLPPYYPDDPLLRADWAEYLNAWQVTDAEVGEVLSRLEREGVLDQTLVVFLTDHGISHLRGKQFLYDEGIHVPLIVRLPGAQQAGTVRPDLVEHIDVAALSLAAAGIPIPAPVQGRDVLAPDYEPRTYAFAARDRGDETVDVIRSVRTDRYKYIRNYYSDRPHAQPNQYKDAKPILQRLRTLHAEDALTAMQARPFEPTRPPEELYDLEADPHETINLADVPAHAETLQELRGVHMGWMEQTRDMGLIPEPILEELGRTHGSKYAAMRAIDHAALVRAIVETIEAGESGDAAGLLGRLDAPEPSVRFYAARGLARIGADEDNVQSALLEAMMDPSAAVRVEAARALGLLGRPGVALPLLTDALEHQNLLVTLYAARALEDLLPIARPPRAVIEAAADGPYDFTRRVARRMLAAYDALAQR